MIRRNISIPRRDYDQVRILGRKIGANFSATLRYIIRLDTTQTEMKRHGVVIEENEQNQFDE